MLKISEIWSYPIKSLAGIQHLEAYCDQRGLAYDRSWMIIDQNNRFISQRSHPSMALLQPHITENNNVLESLTLSHIGNKSNYISMSAHEAYGTGNMPITATVWDDTVQVIEAKGMVNAWLSEQLGSYCRLVYLPKSNKRLVDKKYRKSDENITSLSDGYPYLLVTEASLEVLNQKLTEKIDMRRFRPNIVVSGAEPFAEDNWNTISNGTVSWQVAKPCARCQIPNINPITALSTNEVIKTLASFRTLKNKVIFGQNLLISVLGTIHKGDTLQIN
jgi:uncharacterized protein